MIFAMSHTKKTKQNHHVSVPFKMGLYLYICMAFEFILKTKTKKMMRNRETDKKPPDFLGPISLLPSSASPIPRPASQDLGFLPRAKQLKEPCQGLSAITSMPGLAGLPMLRYAVDIHCRSSMRYIYICTYV